MREAAIVSVARTPIGRAFRGAFNQTHGATMAGHVIEHAVLRAGLPLRVPGTTINRYCASGLQAISTASGRVIADGANVVVAGGVESISLVQNIMNTHDFTEEWILRHEPDMYMPMLQTADAVAKKYDVSRERQDAYALQSQQRVA